MKKHVLFLSNGYGEDSFTALILGEFLKEAEVQEIPLLADVIPLVGEGKAFEDLVYRFPDRVRLLHTSPPLPYGGVYLGRFPRRFFRFFSDALQGGAQNLSAVARLLWNLSPTLDMIVGIGDALPLILSSLFARKRVYLFACAHTDLLRTQRKPYERLGRVTAHFFRHGTERVYTRDAPTALWFQSLGIRAVFLGFVGPEIPQCSRKGQNILFLPGHRGDWERNFLFLTRTILLAEETLASFALHFVFPPERTASEIREAIGKGGGTPVSSSSFLLGRWVISFSQGDYLARLQDAGLVVGFAGTALEYAAFSGIPCIEPYLEDAIQANPYFLFLRQALLLREALTPGGNTPEKAATTLRGVLKDLPWFQRRAWEFTQRTWEGKGDGARNIARDLVNTLRTLPRCRGTVPALGDSHTGTP